MYYKPLRFGSDYVLGTRPDLDTLKPGADLLFVDKNVDGNDIRAVGFFLGFRQSGPYENTPTPFHFGYVFLLTPLVAACPYANMSERTQDFIKYMYPMLFSGVDHYEHRYVPIIRSTPGFTSIHLHKNVTHPIIPGIPQRHAPPKMKASAALMTSTPLHPEAVPGIHECGCGFRNEYVSKSAFINGKYVCRNCREHWTS